MHTCTHKQTESTCWDNIDICSSWTRVSLPLLVFPLLPLPTSLAETAAAPCYVFTWRVLSPFITVIVLFSSLLVWGPPGMGWWIITGSTCLAKLLPPLPPPPTLLFHIEKEGKPNQRTKSF